MTTLRHVQLISQPRVCFFQALFSLLGNVGQNLNRASPLQVKGSGHQARPIVPFGKVHVRDRVFLIQQA